MLDIGTLGGSYAQAWAINDAGFVTGNAQQASRFISIDQPIATHAFIWGAKTGMLDLGTLAGDFSYGTFINARNHVVGYSTIDKENDRVHAFLFNGEKMQDLGSLSAGAPASDRSFALGVNDNDEVVGYTYLPASDPVVGDGPSYASRQVAFVYRNGTMVDLNNLMGDEARNYQLYSATAINNNGQIAAIAFDVRANAFRAVLLTPRKASFGVVITEATYWADYHALVVQASVPPQSPTMAAPALDVYNVDGKRIGNLARSFDGSYSAKLFSPTNPKEIAVTSSLGGTARATVKDSATGLASAKP
jgi:probable HAF family extracellular repeat protein